jgi:hypothetical protein
MKTLHMYGASDDLIEVEGIAGEDEYSGTTNGNPYVTTFVVKSPSEPLGLEIHVLYAGGWSFAVQPTEDKDGDFCEFPNWPIRRTWGDGEYNRGYSELLEIDVPDDAVIKQK